MSTAGVSTTALDRTLAALAHPVRREIVDRLMGASRSVTELAEPFDMTVSAVSMPIKTLEKAGLVARGRDALWRPCRLDAAPLREVVDWLERYRRFWGDSLDRLDAYAQTLDVEGGLMSQTLAADADARGPGKLVLTRMVRSERRLVWRLWTESRHLGVLPFGGVGGGAGP
jgi:DNA-binding transcriptional ArsR family regulator